MSNAADFAYMQVRLQARHGRRPDEQLWQRLQGTAGLANYLQAARQTTLLPWVSGLHASHGSHDIEHTLRSLLRDYVDLVARWLPVQWRSTILWTRLLPELPAIQHLLQGEAAPAWMLNNPRLRPFTSENEHTRIRAMLESGWRDVVQAWQQGKAPADAWMENWRRRWPGPVRLHTGLQHLCTLFQPQVKPPPVAAGHTARQRALLAEQLASAFRRYSFQPAAACAHLALVTLDLERLRAELITRALFPDDAGTGT